ncbi:MAG: hypothetical protein NC102_07125 [Clostridium sp.]|nr:hypothetical protein [Clostridium sp.]
MIQIEDIIIDLCGNGFMEPYLRRELEKPKAAEEDGAEQKPMPEPMAALRITSDSGNSQDVEFNRICAEKELPILSLYAPMIVGTGMTGLPREMAASLYRGLFFNVKGNMARLSLIHASDLAKAAALAVGTDASFTVTDGADPTVEDLAEAMSYRMGDKRIYTVKPWVARLIYGKEYYAQLTTDHIVSDTFRQAYPDFAPTPVTQYLRTHVYDEKSL